MEPSVPPFSFAVRCFFAGFPCPSRAASHCLMRSFSIFSKGTNTGLVALTASLNRLSSRFLA